MIPQDNLMNALASLMRAMTLMWILFMLSKIYKNIVEAHKKHVYNSVEYKGCNIYPEKQEIHNH